jgi:acyl-CoA-binding protein
MAEETLDLKARFEAAAAASKMLPAKPDNSTLLKLYAHFKQATEGDIEGERPGGFDFVAGAKHDAWLKLEGMSQEDAMRAYIAEVERLKG